MKNRKNIARPALFFATVYWGIWLGGYVFNALMLVPLWSHNPPESIITYFNDPHYSLYFFSLVVPGVFLMTLVAWLLTIKLDTAGRVWLGRATVLAWIMFPLKVYMIILIGRVVVTSIDGKFGAETMSTLNLWINLNWLTIVVGTVILIFHLMAILNFNSPRSTKESVS